jgi:hypothetical protein
MLTRSLALAAVLCLLAATGARAQEDDRSDSDPMRPILFSVRPEFSKPADGVWRMQNIARFDMATVRQRRWFSGKRGMLWRFEVPLVSAGTPAAGSSTGLGDSYAQLLVVPWLSGRFALVVGSGLSLPTATDTLLGTGKAIAAPAVAPVWFLRGLGMVYAKVQNFTSFAGDAERADYNYMLITPTLIRKVGRRSWILVDTETKTDWRQHGKTGVKSGLQYGWLLPNGLGLWVKPEAWWGPNRGGQWNLKTGIVWYRSNR